MALSARNPNAILEEIYVEKVKLDEEEQDKSNRIIEVFREVMIRRMCANNGLFHAMYRELYYTGSFFDGLKICEPDEYDLNLVLDPKIPGSKTYHDGKCVPGYVLYGFRKEILPRYTLNEKNKLMKLYEEKYVVDPTKVKTWVQDILNQTLPSLRNQFGHYGISDVKINGDGTALTLNILSKFGPDVDVDLVPVFSIKGGSVKKKHYPKLWDAVQNTKKLFKKGTKRDFRRRVNRTLREDCRLIPKVDKNNPSLPYWHLNFRHVENQILMDKQCAKKVIKLMKYLRDCNQDQIGELFSYCMKTIVVLRSWKIPMMIVIMGNQQITF